MEGIQCVLTVKLPAGNDTGYKGTNIDSIVCI
jgi:hypothetical protein